MQGKHATALCSLSLTVRMVALAAAI